MTVRLSPDITKRKGKILATIFCGDEDMDAYLGAIDSDKLDDMACFVRFLVFECRGERMIQLGIGIALHRDFSTSPTCLAGPHRDPKFVGIATLTHDRETSRYLEITKMSLLYKDCQREMI